jgi:hypothetical protein
VYDASVRGPICFDPEASRTVMPYYELRSKLGTEGMTPDQIAAGVEAAFARGELPKREGVTFAYMWSADQNLGPGVGHWHPHMISSHRTTKIRCSGTTSSQSRFRSYRMTPERRLRPS